MLVPFWGMCFFIICVVFLPGLFSFLCVLDKRFLIWAVSIADAGTLFCITPSESLQNTKKTDSNKGVIRCRIRTFFSVSPEDPSLVTADGKMWRAGQVIRNPWEVLQGAALQTRGHHCQHTEQGNHLCSHKITFTFPGRHWHCSKQAQTGKGTW